MLQARANGTRYNLRKDFLRPGAAVVPKRRTEGADGSRESQRLRHGQSDRFLMSPMGGALSLEEEEEDK